MKLKGFSNPFRVQNKGELWDKPASIMLMLCIVMISFMGCNQSLKETKNFIWKASKGENTVYLVGTMHAVPKGYKLISDKLESIIKETDGIAVEADLADEKNKNKNIAEQQKRLMLENGNIEGYLSEGEVNKLKSMLIDYKINYEQVKKYSPYGLLSCINYTQVSALGLTSSGLDTALLERYKKDGKPIVELEGLDYQLNVIDEIYTLDSLRKYINEYQGGSAAKEMIDQKDAFGSYVNGDLNSLEKFAKQDSVLYTGNVYDIFIKDRNINMAKKIDQLAASGKRYLIAVGALHFAGDDSILKKLEEAGYRIETVN